MDNGTMMDVFKFLNYMQLAKSSFVSKQFRNLIRTHRHSLARLYVSEFMMERLYEGTMFTDDSLSSYITYIEMYNKRLSAEEYNKWVIHNGYSKQIPFESLDLIESLGCSWPSKGDVRKFYHLIAFVDYNAVFNAKVELNHENWPLFQHFIRLITDPFVYFGQMALTPQNDVFNLLRRKTNPDFCHLRCRKFELNLDGDSTNFFSWIKNHVLCSKFQIWNYRSGCFSQGQLPEAVLIDFFLTGALCTSEFKVKYGTYPFKIIIEFVQKFMDLKSCDEYQVVEFIEWKVETGSVEELKRECAKFVVKEEGNHRTFEFVNNDIGKKLQITITHKNYYNIDYLGHYYIKFSKI